MHALFDHTITSNRPTLVMFRGAANVPDVEVVGLMRSLFADHDIATDGGYRRRRWTTANMSSLNGVLGHEER